MSWSAVPLLLCSVISLCLDIKLCSAALLSHSAVVTGPTDLDIQARLLSDELDCDFDNTTYCRLHNNGGWSFQQSFLEEAQQPSPVSSGQYFQFVSLKKISNYDFLSFFYLELWLHISFFCAKAPSHSWTLHYYRHCFIKKWMSSSLGIFQPVIFPFFRVSRADCFVTNSVDRHPLSPF